MAHHAVILAVAGDADLHAVRKVTINMTGNAVLGTSLENVGFSAAEAVKWVFDGKYATDETADVTEIMTGDSPPHAPNKENKGK